ncbi:DUF1643 domain-containing protein [Tichowtungia aerotolerans]|uniref:DUF1643 domain-containing protein n=1 Tax=Tichowtungia aerotolerans TaxID=2697043 RepID=A0A6P1MG15_9BACT|nr:DUF1643 domain-containing protein [Tichowtungia aerotolerans]QHI70015.1 DUF1643 domain-containing protein [Tichowtungia aerotolerans]
MSEFLYAAELKKTFRCYGHFYRLNVKGTEPLLCRSVLEITSLPREAVGAGTDPDDLFSTPNSEPSLPDAVVIMMNPGSSRPIEEGDTESLLHMPLSENFRKPLVLTQPDNTQYQLMRIAVSKGWTHLRILNISDIRDPKSPSFIARTKALDAVEGGEAHSMFSKAREMERKQMLRRKPGAPFILGWGQDAGLIPLAKQCLDCIEGEPIVTVPAGNDPVLTAHPSPMLQAKKEAWLDAIRSALQ